MKKNLFIVTAIATLVSTAAVAHPCTGAGCAPTKGTGTIEINAGITPYAIVGLQDVSGETLNKTDFIDAKINIGCANEADFDATVAAVSKPVYVKTNSCDVTMEVEHKDLKGGCNGQTHCEEGGTTIPTTYWIDSKNLSSPVKIADKPNSGGTSIGDFKIQTDIANATNKVDGMVPSGAYCVTLNVTIKAN